MKYAVLTVSLVIFILFVPHFEKTMQNRPTYAKLGFVPQGKIYRAVLGSFRWFEGEYYTFKSVIYYGGKVKDITYNNGRNVEYYNLYRTIETAIILNPYNEDAYYFAQGAFVWGVGQIRAVNGLLRYVYKYRPWDFQIPFFLGFNYAYFLHNYKEAAKYFKQAADLTHSPLFTNLAARYFYEGGNTKLGITYLEYMIKNTKNESVKKIYKTRLKALVAIEYLSRAVNKFKLKFKRLPKNLDELVEKGIIKNIPKDPYGGKFYIDKKGIVKTTSKLAKGWKNESNRSKKSH
jgi:competence protein ComGC